MENRKKIDDLFKNELGNYTETPPPAVWDSLEKKLDNMPSSKPRGPFTWLGYFAMVAVLVVLSIIVARNISGSADTNNKTTADNNVPAQQNTTSTASNNKQNSTPPGNTDNSTTAANGNEITNADKKDNEPGNKQGNNSRQTDDAGSNNTIQNDDKRNSNATEVADANKTQSTTGAFLTAGRQKNKHKHGSRSSAKTTAQFMADNNQNKFTKETTWAGTQQSQNVFNSGPKSTDEQADSNTKGNEESTLPGNTGTSSHSDNNNNTPPPPPPPPPAKPQFDRFEAGIKGGYEQGFDNDAAKKAVISPYLQYKISHKFAIMLQPAIKAASIDSRVIGSPRTYYSKNNDSRITRDSIPVIDGGTGEIILLEWNYRNTETHDSIVKTNVTGGTYMEYELPVLLKYYIAKDFSVYGGVNIAFSKLVGLTEHTYNSGPIMRTTVADTFVVASAPAPPPPKSLQFSYTGAPYSSYTGPQYPAPKGSLIRFGYMFGCSYEYNKKWLFDALIQQGMASPNMQGGYNTNTPLSAPYIRLTIGYKLLNR